MAQKKQKQQTQIPHTKIEYSKNTQEQPADKNVTHAPRPVKDTQKPKSLPRTQKK